MSHNPETNRHPRETNPHFSPLQPPIQHEGQHSQQSQPRQQGQHSQPHGEQVLQPQHLGQKPSGRGRKPPQQRRKPTFSSPWAPKLPHQDQQPSGRSEPHQHQGQRSSDRRPFETVPPGTEMNVRDQGQHPQTHGQEEPSQTQHQGQQSSSPSPWMTLPKPHGQHESPWVKLPRVGQQPPTHGPLDPRAQNQDHRSGPQMPRPSSTKFTTWFLAVFCAIFWVVVILGGIVVLIVYLVFRPRSPWFDISSATLNLAYLDMGYLLNADLRVLANFTNPNKKVSVDFRYVTLDLYHANTLIATQYIEPFKAAKRETKFADIHMVTSQVRLPLQESQQLQKQIDSNRVLFEIKGVFHARSILGNFLGYSYRLHAHCNIVLAGPPSGILRASKCKTKH